MKHENEQVAAIEYHLLGDLWLPHSVFTSSPSRGPAADFCYGEFDFNWCRRDRTLYYHCSGSGPGGFYIHPNGKGNWPKLKLWWDSAFTYPRNGGKFSLKELSHRTVKRFGYEIIAAPIPLRSDDGTVQSANPFEMALHGDTVYCSRCEDDLPSEHLCHHIWWCDKCGWYSSPSERCKHRRKPR